MDKHYVNSVTYVFYVFKLTDSPVCRQYCVMGDEGDSHLAFKSYLVLSRNEYSIEPKCTTLAFSSASKTGMHDCKARRTY